MIRITKLEVLDQKTIRFFFSDGVKKTIDFTPFIKEDKLSSLLSDPSFFRQVKLYENGRGIFWPNEFDFCPDFLRQYDPQKNRTLANS